MLCPPIKKTRVVAIGVSIALMSFFTAVKLYASFFAYFEGSTYFTADVAAIRIGYPDGRIIAVAKAGTSLTVSSLSGDRRGEWVGVSYKDRSRIINGLVEKRQTSFDADHVSGKVFQPRKR